MANIQDTAQTIARSHASPFRRGLRNAALLAAVVFALATLSVSPTVSAQSLQDARPNNGAVCANDLRAISTPKPNYPPEALRAGQSGEVLVEFTVWTDGSVISARVVRGVPPRVFDREAVAAVKRWRFQPICSPVTTRRSIAFRPGR